jgi:acyl-CoA thioesterase
MTEAQPLTPLTALLQQLKPIEVGYSCTVPPDWLQGRAIYGGLSAALCLAGTLKTYSDLPPLRSAQITFIGPASSDIEIRPALMRKGKSTAFITTDLTSAGNVAVHATFCFGTVRASTLSHMSLPAPSVLGISTSRPFFNDKAPKFAAHFESRLAGGAAPVSGASEADFSVWVRHRDRENTQSAIGLVALADALPPAAISLFTEIAPISSMTWMFDMLTDAPATEDGWWLSRSTAQSVRDGYSSQSMALWNTRGEPVMVGRQNVAVFV